ncbi:hypothetical protein TELCIR_04678 [Teladorsagia circumcincta]|uniref:Uncharacterized protein n=1 Tax=Teladorsagia circumcincta TaxID=45464 RepID=A0A2G9USW6_TELCI|nr:hypothetical protein TELCIR_04678 [Teladorsagia circumcincta]
MRQNMPSGQLQTLVDAYDDFVYNHNTPMSKVVSKVVKGCEPDKQKAFSALFSILERNADMVSLKCPDDRWAEIDNEARKNIDRLFARGRGKKNAALSESQFEQAKNSMRKRKRHVLTELGAGFLNPALQKKKNEPVEPVILKLEPYCRGLAELNNRLKKS